MKKPTKVKKPLSPKMRKHLKRMHEAAQLAAAKRRKAKKVTQAKKTAAPKKRKETVKGDPCQLELLLSIPAPASSPVVAELTLPAADDGSEPVPSPAVGSSEAPQPGEELL
jgi:hypothetical protein